MVTNSKHPPMYIKSCHVKSPNSDAVVVKELVLDKDNNVVPRLNVIRDPKRRFWITKPPFRTHKLTKEYEDLDKVEEYTCANSELEREIHKKLYGYYPRRNVYLRYLCNSPYVYGADVPLECLIRHKYNEKYGNRKPLPMTFGFLDIETSQITDRDHVVLITYMHNNKVYTAIHEAYLWKDINPKDEGIPRERATLDDIKETVYRTLKEYTEEHDFEYNFYISNDHIDLIRWIWDRIHENKTDFVGIWNIDFDIPKIIEQLEEAGVDISEIFCHPEVPADLRKAWYQQDRRSTKQVAHFTEKWHWLHAPGHTQFIDSQNLYSRLRKVKGYKESYKLDNILYDELGERKLDLGPEQSHSIMQKYRFLAYTAYNIFDCIGLYLLEKKNHDIETMYILSGDSPYQQYAYQTKMLANMLYFDCLKDNKVLGTAGANLKNEFNSMIKSSGGTVLPPERREGMGAHALIERPTFETMLYPHTYDSDYSAYYPRVQMGANIAGETKICTTIEIDGELNHTKVHDLFTKLISMDSNAVDIGKNYLNLPDYDEMEKIVCDELDIKK